MILMSTPRQREDRRRREEYKLVARTQPPYQRTIRNYRSGLPTSRCACEDMERREAEDRTIEV